MKFLRKAITVKEEKLFKKNGEFNLTQDLVYLLDTILVILSIEENANIYFINLELRKCGFFVSDPELKQIMDGLNGKGLIGSAQFNVN